MIIVLGGSTERLQKGQRTQAQNKGLVGVEAVSVK